MNETNPTPTQPETLGPTLEQLALESAAFLDRVAGMYVNEQTSRTAQQHAFALRANIESRRAAVAGPRGDESIRAAAESAMKRLDKAQEVKEGRLDLRGGNQREGFRIWLEDAMRSVAATSSPTAAESLRDLLGRFLFDKYGCTIEHHRMKVLKHFVEWAETESTSAPPESTRVEGEQD